MTPSNIIAGGYNWNIDKHLVRHGLDTQDYHPRCSVTSQTTTHSVTLKQYTLNSNDIVSVQSTTYKTKPVCPQPTKYYSMLEAPTEQYY